MNASQILLLALPLIAVQLGLMLFALRDLFSPNRVVAGGSKPVWALVIVFGELVGPIAYFLAGRRDA
ncbi:MAG: PLD nuclease N-terminal domain-containing protein [Chloroflexota bacterium]